VKQARQDDIKIGSVIETILPFGKITKAILLEIERVVRSVNRRFEITQNRIDPLETRQVRSLAFLLSSAPSKSQ